MALVKCKECNKEISSEANSCPHCGYVLKTTNQKASPKKGLGCSSLILVLAILIAAGWFYNNKTSQDLIESTGTKSDGSALNDTPMDMVDIDEESPEIQFLVGLALPELKKFVAENQYVSSPLEKGNSSDYVFWENYNKENDDKLYSEIQIWIKNNKVIKAQWVYGGERVKTKIASRKEFERIKTKINEKIGEPLLDTKTLDGKVVGWVYKNVSITLSLELPDTKYGLPILKIIQSENETKKQYR